MASVVTAVFGGYDVPARQRPQDTPTDWVCVTDDPGMSVPAPWRLMVATPEFGDPRMAAKWWKCQPWEATGDPDTVWIDGNMAVRSKRFVSEALACRVGGVATFRHPQRSCIYDEAQASLDLAPAKYGHLSPSVMEQVAHYRGEGHPAMWGLWAMGCIAWHPDTAGLAGEWLAECERWTYQDQLSFPVVCRRNGIRPGEFPHEQIDTRTGRLENPWLRILPHRLAT